MEKKLLTVDDVVQRLQISRRTMEAMLSKGEGPTFCWIGRSRRWREEELEAWIQSCFDAKAKEDSTTEQPGNNLPGAL